MAAACFTMAAAAGALWNAFNSSQAVQASKRTASANLLLSVTKDYAAPEFGKAMERLRAWKDIQGDGFVSEYVKRLKSGDLTAADLPGERRRVASFFNALRVFCEQEVLDRRLVARTLGEAGFKFFVEVVDPLDRAHNEEVMGQKYDSVNRDFCQSLLDDFFPSNR